MLQFTNIFMKLANSINAMESVNKAVSYLVIPTLLQRFASICLLKEEKTRSEKKKLRSTMLHNHSDGHPVVFTASSVKEQG